MNFRRCASIARPAPTTNRRWLPWAGRRRARRRGRARGVVLVRRASGRSRSRSPTVTERAAGTQAAVLNASGYVTARRRATVSSKITGKVVEVNVEEGMAVTEGQVLARLDDATPRAALALAEAQAEAAREAVRENEVRLDEAQLTLGRVTQLAQGRTSPPRPSSTPRKRRSTRIEARIQRCAEQVQRGRAAGRRCSRTDLDNTIIRAPFSGVAISKDAQPGEMVSPVSAGGGFTRTGICTIVDMESLEIEVDVNESYINRVQPRQDVTAVLDAYPDWQIPGARHHDGADGRSPEGHRARAHRVRRSSTRASCRTWA